MCVGVSTHNSFMKRGGKLCFNYKDFGVIWHHALEWNFNLNEFDSSGLNECDILIVKYSTQGILYIWVKMISLIIFQLHFILLDTLGLYLFLYSI